MNLREHEAFCERRSEYMLDFYATHPEARLVARERLVKRQARGEMRYRKYDAALRSACVRAYMAGEDPVQIQRRLQIKRSSFYRFVRGIALYRPWRRAR